MFENGRPLTRARFAAEVRRALSSAGIDQSQYCSHSFRIGAATTTAAKGIEESIIKNVRAMGECCISVVCAYSQEPAAGGVKSPCSVTLMLFLCYVDAPCWCICVSLASGSVLVLFLFYIKKKQLKTKN